MFFRFSAIAALFTALLCFAPRSARAADYPVITFEYADLYDRFCADVTKTKIEPSAIEEAQSRIGEIHKVWQKEAPQLLKMTVKLTKAPFAFAETKAALSLCNPGSLSFPLIFDIRKYLKAINGEQARPLADFVDTVFHETLHRYINDRKAKLTGATTPLLEKYKDEPARVRNHIHLFALFDEVYRRLGRENYLNQMIALDEKSANAAVFKRAREIVAAEGADNVICEISKRGCPDSNKH